MMRWGAFLGLGGLIGLIFEKKKRREKLRRGRKHWRRKKVSNCKGVGRW